MAPEEDFHFSDLTPILQKTFDELFGPRAKINRERWDFLQIDPEFKARVQSIRETEKIPKINPDLDIKAGFIPHDYWEEEVVVSHYLDSLGRTKRARIERAIENLLQDFSLPLNFHDWVQYLLLYRKPMKGTPRYNWYFLDDIINNQKEARRLPISSKEKKFWLREFRWRLGIKNGRVPKQYAKAYNELIRLLDSAPKNKQRRMRTFDSAMEAIERDGIYLKLAVEIIPENEATEVAEKRLETTLRKRVSRLLKRTKKSKETEK